MAQIQYTPYVNQATTQSNSIELPDFDVPIIRRQQKPKEEIVLAPLPELQAPTQTITKGIISNPKNINVGNMQGALDALSNAGISFRVTSGVRPGALTAQGRQSHHANGNAVDIVIDDYEDAKRKIKASKELQDVFNTNKWGILEETTPDVLARTKGTGPHWHIGLDNIAIENFKRMIARHGAKLQNGNKIEYSPYINQSFDKPSSKNIQFWKQPEYEPMVLIREKPKGYKRQYNLVAEEPVVEIPEATPERTIEDLAKFTGSFETFSPNVYILNTSDGKPQKLAGYGSANPEIIKLAEQGKLTEEIARKEMIRKLQAEYDDWDKKVPNFKNLSRGVQLALVDTSYNGKGVTGTIKDSPNLMGLINSGVTDPKLLAEHMTHSKSANGWLGVRSAARRAMALGEYDWDYPTVDKYGRQVDYSKYKGPQDWKSSPYYNK